MIYSTLSMLRAPWASLLSPVIQDIDELESTNAQSLVNLKVLAPPTDLLSLPTIKYAYDPLPAVPRLLSHSQFRLQVGALAPSKHTSRNSVRLEPLAAGLPYRSSINHVHASKHWKVNLDESVQLLDLLAKDHSASDIEVEHGVTLTRLAKKALRPGKEYQMVLATHYMFPYADEQRILQIAALMIMYFVFDDKVEETPNDKLRVFRDDFFRRLEGHHDNDSNRSALQSHIDSIISGIEANDSSCGNGGREMIEALQGAFRCVRPGVNGFQSISEYLAFRRQNVGADFVIAAAKFSLSSSIPTTSPRYTRFLHLLSDHLGLVNDLASYDKELRALECGETDDMINLVQVIKTVTGLQGTDDAKAVAWALQLQIEREMMAEIERLKQDIPIHPEEAAFLDACVSAATGNVMFCMTTSRYGGEAARI